MVWEVWWCMYTQQAGQTLTRGKAFKARTWSWLTQVNLWHKQAADDYITESLGKVFLTTQETRYMPPRNSCIPGSQERRHIPLFT